PAPAAFAAVSTVNAPCAPPCDAASNVETPETPGVSVDAVPWTSGIPGAPPDGLPAALAPAPVAVLVPPVIPPTVVATAAPPAPVALEAPRSVTLAPPPTP